MISEIFLSELNEVLKPLQNDGRIGPVHVCLYLALLQCSGGQTEWFPITRATMMELSRLKGRSTYSKIMKELAELGLIGYEPSKSFRKRSRARVNELPGGVIRLPIALRL